MNKFDIVGTLATIRPSATFLQLHHYRNLAGEVADYNIVFHISYQSALERSIAALQSYKPENDLEIQAKSELIDGYQSSLTKMDSFLDEKSYHHFYDENGSLIKGVKLHKKTDTLHLYGAVVSKKTLAPGKYKKTNKSPLSLAKDKLRKMTPINSFRQFKITPSQVEKITVERLEIIPTE